MILDDFGTSGLTSTVYDPPSAPRRSIALRTAITPDVPVQKSEFGNTGVTGSSLPIARPNSKDTPQHASEICCHPLRYDHGPYLMAASRLARVSKVMSVCQGCSPAITVLSHNNEPSLAIFGQFQEPFWREPILVQNTRSITLHNNIRLADKSA